MSLQETAARKQPTKEVLIEAMNITWYVQNKAPIRPILDKSPDELLRKKRPNISYFI